MLLSSSQCKACGLTQETRTAHCASKDGKIYNETFCKKEKPELVKPCEAPACEFQWFTSQWSNCSAECGKGVQNRRVICGQFEGEAVKKASDESKCTDEKPEVTKDCEVDAECPGQWFTGPWTVCSEDCGGGMKTRKVLCLANGTAVSAKQCGEAEIVFASEECNKDPCIEDETIPVDAGSTTITEDDQGEEWCDDEDDDNGETTDSLEVVKITTIEDTSVTADLTSLSSDDTEATITDDDFMQSDSTDTSITDNLRKRSSSHWWITTFIM